MIAISGIQATIVIVCLSICMNVMTSVAQNSEQIIAISERQKSTENKADRALESSAQALTLSGRAEANIQWIREGLTELKIAVRQGNQKQ